MWKNRELLDATWDRRVNRRAKLHEQRRRSEQKVAKNLWIAINYE
jgi:hypothetical protein